MKISTDAQFEDHRGKIVDLLVNESIDAITHITFTPKAIRGNHFHRQTTQWTFVTKGSIVYASRRPGEETVKEVLHAGDFVVAAPNEAHAFRAQDNAEILVFTKGPRAGFDYEKDTFRLDVPILGDE